MVLPFLGTTSWNVKNNIIRSFRKIVPFANVKVVFKTQRRLSSCFNFKDKFPKALMSGVIYKYTCAECNLSYVGSTKRYWEKRLEEHTHLSARTGEPLSGMIVYALLQHVKSDDQLIVSILPLSEGKVTRTCSKSRKAFSSAN